MDKYLDLITSQHRTRPKFIAFLSALLRVAGDIEQLLQTMSAHFDLETAVGAQLDILADRVGVVRGEFDDETLRMLIKAAILRNTWNGSTSQAYDTWEMIFPEITMRIDSNTNMEKVVLIIGSLTALQRQMILSGLIVPKAAGVLMRFTFLDPEKPVFAYDTGTIVDLLGWDECEWEKALWDGAERIEIPVGNVAYLAGWDEGSWDSSDSIVTQDNSEEA